MKNKLLLLAISFVMIITVISGCSTPVVEETPPTPDTDAVSSASLAVDEASFKQKISADGNWIILSAKDFNFTEDLIVEGAFDKRSVALADNDMKEYTLVVPSLVIKSVDTLLEYGTVKGDVYVEASGFTTKETTIDGNLFFATEELKEAFIPDDLTEIIGGIEVQEYK